MKGSCRVSAPLRVDRLDTGERQLVRDLVMNLRRDVDLRGFRHDLVGVDGGIPEVTVPAGFVTDFSSIPAPFRVLFRFSSVDLAGCVHDLAYRIQMPRRPADRMWEIVATSGHTKRSRIGRFRGRLGYLGLRLGGHFAYRANASKPLLLRGETSP